VRERWWERGQTSEFILRSHKVALFSNDAVAIAAEIPDSRTESQMMKSSTTETRRSGSSRSEATKIGRRTSLWTYDDKKATIFLVRQAEI
jgi:hypothetical protein